MILLKMFYQIKLNGFIILCLLLTFIPKQFSATYELVTVIELFRHGARSPISNDPWNEWHLQGELTQTRLKQQFLIGKKLRDRYATTLPQIYDPEQLIVKSTGLKRTQQSAEAQLMGLFSDNYCSLKGTSTEQSCLSHQQGDPTNMFTIEILPLEEDYVLQGYFPTTCHITSQLRNLQMLKLFHDHELLSRYEKLVVTAVEQRWIPETNPRTVSAYLETANLFDTIIAAYTEGKKLPFGPESTHWKELEGMFEYFRFFINFGTKTQVLLSSMNFLNQVVEHMTAASAARLNGTNYPKLVLYSAHDMNVVSAAAALGLISMDCLYKKHIMKHSDASPFCFYPDFSSNMLFELWQDKENLSSLHVKLYYNEIEVKLCQDKPCTLKAFSELIKEANQGKTLSDFLEICQSNNVPDIL